MTQKEAMAEIFTAIATGLTPAQEDLSLAALRVATEGTYFASEKGLGAEKVEPDPTELKKEPIPPEFDKAQKELVALLSWPGNLKALPAQIDIVGKRITVNYQPNGLPPLSFVMIKSQGEVQVFYTREKRSYSLSGTPQEVAQKIVILVMPKPRL